MRVHSVLALVLVSLAIVAPANADRARYYHHTGNNQRAGRIVVYDYSPGVAMRAYWAAPWQHRHYFPVTGKAPEVGRDEDLSMGGRDLPERAESYERSWSNSSAFPAATSADEPRGREHPIDPPQIQSETDKFQRLPDPSRQ